jgi:apolipoprotein N-acyltransferase
MALSFPARCILAVVSGAVVAAAFPPLGGRALIFPGIAGLLLALRGLSGTRARTVGFIHGMTAYGIGLSWLYQIFGGVVVVLWMVLAAFTALFADMQGRAQLRGWCGWQMAAFTAVNWCGWEFIRAELFPLRFPWMTAGLAMGPNALLPWIGVYGVSLFVVLAAAFFTLRKRSPTVVVLAVLTIAVLPSSRLPIPSADDPATLEVAGVQFENRSLTDFLAATREMQSDVRHVVWPEYAVPFDIRANQRDWKSLLELCRERDITLTLGTQARPDGGEVWRNIALTLDPTGFLGEHTKIHTVHFFDDGTPGSIAQPVETSHGKVGTPICFDCDYEGVVRKMTAAGAECFLVPLMDAESWTARQHNQHAELFRIRACENGRWMFTCGTSGVSQLIDANGQVHSRLAAMEQGILSGRIKRETSLTIYTRFGWLFPWCVLGVAFVSWLYLIVWRKPALGIVPIAGPG